MIDVTTFSTADLERFAKAPRSPEEARAILHELQDRRWGTGARRRDTGTLPLFGSRKTVEHEHEQEHEGSR